jgi:hypothetical protein
MAFYLMLYPVIIAVRVSIWLFVSMFYVLGFLFALPFTILAEIGKTEQSK